MTAWLLVFELCSLQIPQLTTPGMPYICTDVVYKTFNKETDNKAACEQAIEKVASKESLKKLYLGDVIKGKEFGVKEKPKCLTSADYLAWSERPKPKFDFSQSPMGLKIKAVEERNRNKK